MAYDVDYQAILVAAGLATVIGLLWYLPWTFGALWLREHSFSDEHKKRFRAIVPYLPLGLFTLQVVVAYVLAHVTFAYGVVDVGEALQVGLSTWLGFIATTSLAANFFELRSLIYFAVNAGYALVSLLAMSLVVTFW